jgi:hypothetical protein
MADLVTGKEAPNFRVVSGPPAAVEHACNQLLEDYAAILWNFAVVKDEVVLSVVMIHTRILNRQALANARMSGVRQ